MKESKYNKLFKTTVLALTLFVIIFILLYSSRLATNREYIIESQKNKLETVNKLSASLMMDYFGNIKMSVKAADFWLTKNPDADPRFNEDFIGFVKLLEADMHDNVDIRLVSKNGGLFYIPSKSSQPLADVHDRACFLAQQNVSTSGFYFADPVLSRVTKKWGIPI